MFVVVDNTAMLLLIMPGPLGVCRFRRDVLVSYLDDDLLIARDRHGATEVLRRREFPDALMEGNPSASDEASSAPGI